MRSLTSRVLTSLVWVFTNIAAKNLVQFARNVILWMLLSRREFGLQGMVWIAINGATLLQDLGFQAELVRRKQRIQEAISVTWYANVAIRAVIFVGLFFAAPLFAMHMGEPQIERLLQVASITIVLGAFGSANEAMLRKNFQFKRLLVVETVENVTMTVAQIALAWLGLGVWSLIYGTIVSSLARSICLWWLAPIRLGRFDWGLAKEMLHFGKHMTLSTLGLWLIKNMDYYFVGRYLGAAALGVYILAFKLSEMIAINVVRNLASVFYPAFSEVAQDIDRVRGAWLRALRYSLLVVLPMGVSLMIFSSEVIRTFYPGQEVAIWPMTILLLFSLCRAVGTPVGDLAKAIGKPAYLTRAVEAHVIVMAPALYLLTSNWQSGLESGLVWVSVVVALCPFIGLGVSLHYTSRDVRFTSKQVIGALLPSVGAGIFMAAATMLLKWAWWSLFPGAPPIAVLIVLGSASCVLYVLGLILFFPSVAAEVKQLLRRPRAEKAPESASVTPP